MDYSDVSDFEINSTISIAMRRESENPESKYVVVNDYCNNPADAWPIIAENRISIFFDETDPEYEGTPYRWCSAISTCQKYHVQYLSNPLRAAMIVFLMMQDSK